MGAAFLRLDILLIFLAWFLAWHSFAYEVPVVDTDYSRQICSGMWGGDSTYINSMTGCLIPSGVTYADIVTFDGSSQGQLAMVIYEWTDSKYLGKVIDTNAGYLPKTYICTSSVQAAGHCTKAQLGQFIIDLPDGKSVNDTSFWSARVALDGHSNGMRDENPLANEFWDNPTNPPPSSDYTSPWRQARSPSKDLSISRRQSVNASPSGLFHYKEPIHYVVKKTGYYCAAVVPVTVQSPSMRRAATETYHHSNYTGAVLFRNTFDGKLPATDYPKVIFYFFMFLVYLVLGGVWGWLCYKHMNELLPIQHYLSGLVGLVIIEMVANYAYYRYLNAHGKSTASTVFLIVVAILDAGRNSMSFFMLLVVSLGLSVVKESLGKKMVKCQLLAGAHFFFGILYAIGIVELELKSTSGLLLLLFIVPLAFTLSGFLLWIMYALNATIAELQTRKQHYKLGMFKRLHQILMLVVLVIIIFFIVSSFVFSGRLAEDYAAKSWQVQWWLLDGWMALLYLAAFSAILFLWKPLVLSDELAQDEAEAEDYDLEALQRRQGDDDDDATLVGRRGDGHDAVSGDIVFEIGDEDGGTDDESGNKHKKRRVERLSGENGVAEEREALTSGRIQD